LLLISAGESVVYLCTKWGRERWLLLASMVTRRAENKPFGRSLFVDQ